MSGWNHVTFARRQEKYLKDNERCTVWNAGSLSVFPEEVWEYILNHIQFSTDTHAVLLAFPELDKCFHEKKVNWMIDQVLAQMATKHFVKRRVIKCNVRTWNDCLVKELLKLRLVSKCWKIAVDLLLQNHTDRNPTHLFESVRNPMNSLSYNRMANFHFGATVFKSECHVELFLQQMNGYCGNPFPGKSVYLELKFYDYNACNSLVEKCVEPFEIFGKYVTSLEIYFCGEELRSHLELCKNILKLLSNVLNLQSLTIYGRFDFNSDRESNKYFRQPENWRLFPELPCLDTFNWRARMTHGIIGQNESAWITHMLCNSGSAKQIRKLGTEQHALLLPYLAPRLSGLTEFHLQLSNDRRWNDSVIYNITEQLSNSRQLQTLSISTTVYFRPVLDVTALISLLASLEIRNMILEDINLEENPIPHKSLDLNFAATSTTYLYLKDDLKLSYEFLKRLPNLQILHIYFDDYTRQKGYEDCMLEGLPKRSFVKKLKNYFQRDSTSSKNYLSIARRLRACLLGAYVHDPCVMDHLESIWNELPNLQMLHGSVEVQIVPEEYHFGIWDVRFARECGTKIFLEDKPNWPVTNPHKN